MGFKQLLSDAHVLRLRLLGPAQVEAGDPPVHVDLAAHKGAALMFYLAARPDQAVTRTRLIALLWEASEEQEGRNSLSTALSRLRRALANAPIVALGDSLAWRADANQGVWTDLAAFADLTRPGASRDDLDRAVALWRGPFLEGFDLRGCADWDEWLELERTTWQQRMLEALERAAEAHAADNDWSGALTHARRALAIDPLQERFHRQVMWLHERAGNRAAALAHYRGAAHMLATELGVEPDPTTQRLYREIISSGRDLGPTPLPEPVRDALRARLARLDPDAHELARAAAVLGGDVDFDHARAVAGQDEDRALAALERLLSTHLLREVTGEVGEALYSFSQDKVRQVIYDDLSAARRRVQHRRALDVLSQPGVRTPAERLAYHAWRAQAWDQAVRWSQAAADAAVAVFAYSSAATLFEQALDALDRLPTSTEHQAHSVRLRLRLAQEHLKRAETQFAAIGACPELERTRQAIAALTQP